MKKVLFSIAIVAAGLFIASCGNNVGKGTIQTDTLTYNQYKWFDWIALVPQGKGFQLTQDMPESLKEVTSTKLGYLVTDKVVIELEDFDGKTLDEWKALITKNSPEKVVNGIQDTKIVGRNAFMYPCMMGGSELQKYGYSYYVDFKDFSEAGYGGYKVFSMTIYPADGQPEKIDEVINDEEVKFILDNMTITPKND